MATVPTVAQLERLLEKQRAKLDGLVQHRDRLQRKLAQVEHKIATIGGLMRDGAQVRRTRKRPKNTKTLLQAVVDALNLNKKGLTLRELSAKILEDGYKTASTNFENTVYQIIYNNSDKVAHDPKSRTYRLK